MKKFLKYIIVSVGVLIVTSCSEFLEKLPYDVPPEEYYETAEELEAAIAGVYDRLGVVYGTRWLYMLGHEADEGYYARANVVQGPAVFSFSSTHSYIAQTWAELYAGIFRANFLLKHVDKNQNIPRVTRNRVRGEALFLRGHFYSVLVHLYGGVPLILEPVKDGAADMSVERNTADEVYDQIIEDLEMAEDLVPTITELRFGGRASKSAVRGMLARVWLYRAGYPLRHPEGHANARYWAGKVIDDTEAGHELAPVFQDIFIRYARDEYDIKESIFEVEYWGNRTDIYTETGYVGYANGPSSSNENTGIGFGGLKVTEKLYRTYEANDFRRNWTIANFTYSSSGSSGNKSTGVDDGIYNRSVAKWRREYETLLPKNRAATPQNFPLLRYSDILLMYAEADFYASGAVTDKALTYINLVRRRGFGKLRPGSTDVDAYDLPAGMGAPEFEKAIQDERMREFAFEQMRRADLIRWNIFIPEMRTVLNQMNGAYPLHERLQYAKMRFTNALYDRHLIWPIPAVEMMMNSKMEQNPGW